ncbi:hypothetical protein DWF00_27150 [Bosea caraganae]|uniref:Uncharacterized protein n=1 Tax=Bosea caraganae TaxID=2763117 RepID=A0A370LAN4_9HYPH|nr:hypothetical protein DWF00_27150 [Bosea caraganae]RDJ27966.1 hypothetical protein DWE98_05005 [Bosea caraganae]
MKSDFVRQCLSVSNLAHLTAKLSFSIIDVRTHKQGSSEQLKQILALVDPLHTSQMDGPIRPHDIPPVDARC